MAALRGLVGKREASALLKKKNGGTLPQVAVQDGKFLDWEQSALSMADVERELGMLSNQSTPVSMLKACWRRRRKAADTAVKATGSVYDASNNSLLPLAMLTDHDRSAALSLESLVQFRGRRRSYKMMDRRTDGRDDNSQGRITTSGVISILENRLAAKALRKPRGFAAERAHALAKLALSHHPTLDLQSLYVARNSTIDISKNRPDECLLKNFDIAHTEIHANYSAETPNTIRWYLREHVFTAGDDATWEEAFRRSVGLLRQEDLGTAKKELDRLEALGVEISGARSARSTAELHGAVLAFLTKGVAGAKFGRAKPEERARVLEGCRTLLDAITLGAPSSDSLVRDLGFAGSAKNAVSRFVLSLEEGDPISAAVTGAQAKRALASAFTNASDYERVMMIQVERTLDALLAQTLGTEVVRARSLLEDRDKHGFDEILWAAWSALEATLAAGLDNVRADRPDGQLDSIQRRLSKLVKSIHEGDAAAARNARFIEGRALLTELYGAMGMQLDETKQYLDAAVTRTHFSGIDVDVDTNFSVSMIKESPMHHLQALCSIGMGFSRKSSVTADEIRIQNGAVHLDGQSEVVFDRLLIAKNLEELKRFNPKDTDFCILTAPREKDRMVAVGGLGVDASEAPAGGNHLLVSARDVGASMLAMDLDKLLPFLRKTAKRDNPGLHMRVEGGEIVLKPLAVSLSDGTIDAKKVADLRPGHGRNVEIVDADGDVLSHFEKKGHRVQDVRLYAPEIEETRRPAVLSQAQIAKMPKGEARALVREKPSVLAWMSQDEALKKTGVRIASQASANCVSVADVLREVKVADDSLFDVISTLWTSDRDAGELQADRPGERGWFLDSALYNDVAYRQKRTDAVQKKIRVGLTDHLFDGRQLSPAGKKLVAGVKRACPDLTKRKPWIVRGSGSEDRPGHSAAGLMHTEKNVRTDAGLLTAIIEVLAANFDDLVLHTNMHQGLPPWFNWSTFSVGPQYKADVSGVATSNLSEVTYSAFPGQDTVDRKKRQVESGVLFGPKISRIDALAPNKKTSMLTDAQRESLFRATERIQQMFNEEIEPGQQHDVLVEWVLEKNQLVIVQARAAPRTSLAAA